MNGWWSLDVKTTKFVYQSGSPVTFRALNWAILKGHNTFELEQKFKPHEKRNVYWNNVNVKYDHSILKKRHAKINNANTFILVVSKAKRFLSSVVFNQIAFSFITKFWDVSFRLNSFYDGFSSTRVTAHFNDYISSYAKIDIYRENTYIFQFAVVGTGPFDVARISDTNACSETARSLQSGSLLFSSSKTSSPSLL